MKRCGLVGGGQTIFNFITLHILMCIVAKEDAENPAAAAALSKCLTTPLSEKLENGG